jgi:hypothetical protein
MRGRISPSIINPSASGNIPVAIHSSGEFDAPSQVVVQSLTFGRNALDPSLLKCNLPGEDVNKDGFVDLVCHFGTRLAGFQTGDTLGFLVGKSIDRESGTCCGTMLATRHRLDPPATIRPRPFEMHPYSWLQRTSARASAAFPPFPRRA